MYLSEIYGEVRRIVYCVVMWLCGVVNSLPCAPTEVVDVEQ